MWDTKSHFLENNMQPVPNWTTFHNNPNSLNIKSGIFWDEVKQQFEVYLLKGNKQLHSEYFNTITEALTALNKSTIIFMNNEFHMVPF